MEPKTPQQIAEERMATNMKMVARELELIRFGLEDLISINPKARDVLEKYGLALHISVVEAVKEEHNNTNEQPPTTAAGEQAPATETPKVETKEA